MREGNSKRFDQSGWCATAVMVLFVMGSATSLAGTQYVVVMDPQATEVIFSLQATGHVVRGDLQLLSGELVLEAESGTLVGEIILDSARAQTGNQRRDKAMHRKVLESELYPSIVLRPQRFEGELADSGPSTIALSGTISLHGEDHPLTIEVEVEIEGDRFSAESIFSIPYVEWGLRDPSVLFLRVAKAVEVTVKTAGTINPTSRQE